MVLVVSGGCQQPLSSALVSVCSSLEGTTPGSTSFARLLGSIQAQVLCPLNVTSLWSLGHASLLSLPQNLVDTGSPNRHQKLFPTVHEQPLLISDSYSWGPGPSVAAILGSKTLAFHVLNLLKQGERSKFNSQSADFPSHRN